MNVQNSQPLILFFKLHYLTWESNFAAKAITRGCDLRIVKKARSKYSNWLEQDIYELYFKCWNKHTSILKHNSTIPIWIGKLFQWKQKHYNLIKIFEYITRNFQFCNNNIDFIHDFWLKVMYIFFLQYSVYSKWITCFRVICMEVLLIIKSQ